MEQKDDWHLTDELHYEHGQGDPFAAAVRATRMPMVITDPNLPDNPIVFCNVAFQTLTGYSRDEIVGRNCRFLQGPETNREDVARVRRAIESSRDVAVDLLNYRKDGTKFWNALYLSPVRDKDGIVRFFFASQLDVTDRIEVQARLSRQKEIIEEEVRRRTGELESAVNAKTMLLHEVDHRVKNNLTMIGALLRLQARSIGNSEFSKRLNAMLERVDALAAVHRQLYQSTELTSFDLSGFAKTLAGDIIGASGRTNIVFDAVVDPVVVSADKATALGLVLNEIITNAVKHAYADGRGGTLSLRTTHVGDTDEISISDDGQGLSGSEPSGLGRAFISRLAEQTGGRAEWRSANPGTTVSIIIPREVKRGD